MQSNQLRSLSQYQLCKPLSTCERGVLRESIVKNGVLVAVIVDEDRNILDGRERYEIAKELGIDDIPVEIVHGLSEEQKRDLILQLNCHRRQVSTADKKDLAKNELRHRQGNISDNALGKLVGLSDKTIKGVREELLESSEIPNLVVREGKDGVRRPARNPRRRSISVSSLREAQKAAAILREHGDDLPETRMDLWHAKKKARRAHYANLGSGNCPPPPAEYQAICCDFRDLLPKGWVKPDSVKLVYTDFLWQKAWSPSLPDLAKVTKRDTPPLAVWSSLTPAATSCPRPSMPSEAPASAGCR